MKFLHVIISFLFLASSAFALTPFSLENLKELNVKILEKQKLLTEKEKENYTKRVKEKLEKIGLKTKSKKFANLLIQIENIKIDKITVLHVKLSLVEEVQLDRAQPTYGLGLGFLKEDFFESEDVKEDIDQSIEFLVEDFIDQYKEENK